MTSDLIPRLRAVGFTATAHDFRAGRISLAEVAERLRRDAPRVKEPTRSARLALAAEVEDIAAGRGQLLGPLPQGWES
jgi:hypothetical protein